MVKLTNTGNYYKHKKYVKTDEKTTFACKNERDLTT